MKLTIKDLKSRYSSQRGPVYACEDINFDLNDGQSIGIAGESACGKSTLGLSIIRMLQGGKTTGTILFGDKSILDLSDSEFDQNYRWKKFP